MNEQTEHHGVNARQICFFAAFLLPTLKLLDAPAILAKAAGNDLLFPVFLQYLAQSIPILCLLIVKAKTGQGPFSLVKERFGTIAHKIVLVLYAAFFLFYALRPLLDLEKFSYAAFYDTASSAFVFAPFFFLCAYLCSKSLSTLGRLADVCLPIFLVSFVLLFFLGISSADFAALLPFFGNPIADSFSGFYESIPLFFDAALFIPLIERMPYRKKDGVKIISSYWIGGAFVLLFTALFYGTYTSIAQREHFAIAKIAQYFPALDVIGRIDLIFVYLLVIVLFFATCVPCVHCVDSLFNAFPLKTRVPFAAVLNLALLTFTFFFNKRYNAVVNLIKSLTPIFLVFSTLLPVLSLLFLIKTTKNKGAGKRFSENLPKNKEVRLEN
ncbi:MAG: GerAB/ArcD/ProY family transporter [Clostridia bacterium]|nr:GerAB/ArcD/ProY family transporter [Clostridia bacterium]